MSMEKSINGSEGIEALGNNDLRRVYIESSNLDHIEKNALTETFHIIKHIFPFAVYIDGKIYQKDDDQCTRVPEVWRGIDLTLACIAHDLCYYNIAEYNQHNFSFKDAFNHCQDVFLEDMNTLKRDQRANQYKPLFGLTYYLGVKFIPYSFTNFILNQDKSAIMYSMILKKYHSDIQYKNLMDESEILDIKKMSDEIIEYCHTLRQDLDSSGRSFLDKVKHRDHPRDLIVRTQLYGCEELEASVPL